jgi:hypothetical protein
MEFHNPDLARTRDDCARMFCSTIMRGLSFAMDVCEDIPMSRGIEGARAKFRKACDFISESEITSQIGAIIVNWDEQIVSCDDSFFAHVDIASIIGKVSARDGSIGRAAAGMDADECAKWRARFMTSTALHDRSVLLDALNLLLVLYAKHELL